MQFLHISGYRFISLPYEEIAALQSQWLMRCRDLQLKGTALISQEGVNLSIAGTIENIKLFRIQLDADSRFRNIPFHETYAKTQPFRRLKIKLKNEIITLRQTGVTPSKTTRAPAVSPAELKQWLDEKRDLTLLDVRNQYEVGFGTFKNAIHLHLNDFSGFPEKIKHITPNKPIVMFCTGGIRCEKAAMYLLGNGFSNVLQLDGGILGYFKQIGGAHYQGECFVFDERISIDSHLHETGAHQSRSSQGYVLMLCHSEQCYTERN